MPREITMPKLSDTMEEGKVLRWLKGEGDAVERGDILAEIETDKADMEMEAFDSGVLLAITVKAGQTAAVGDVIGYIGEAGEKLEEETGQEREGEDGRRAAAGDGAAMAARPVSKRPSREEVEERKAGARPTAELERPRERRETARPRAAPPGGGKAFAEAAKRTVEAPERGRAAETRGRATADGTREETGAVEPVEEVAGPHADIADVIEAEGEEEEEGEEGFARQAPEGHPRAWHRPAPTKGLNDRMPVRGARAERLPRVKVSPVARRLAAETGLDLAGLEGSGPAGRIVRRDVERALRELDRARTRPAPAAVPRKPAAGPGTKPARSVAEELPVPVARGELGIAIPHSRIRRAIATRMAESKRTVPHFYTTAAVWMEEALRLKEALALRDPGAKVSVSHLIVKAAGLALERFPRVMGVFEESGIRIPERIDVGLAVAVEDGLIVPVLRDCAGKPLREIAREAQDIVGRVRSGKLAQDDLQGATFSISNMGMFEIEQFAAIIAPPQSAILAVGGTADEPVVRDGQVVPGKVMRMTLSADHRVVDGVLAAAFLVEVKRFLENPLALVV